MRSRRAKSHAAPFMLRGARVSESRLCPRCWLCAIHALTCASHNPAHLKATSRLGAKTARQHGRNNSFFGAPIGLLFTIDHRPGQGSWLDLGMFMQGIMTSARATHDTCAQAAFAPPTPPSAATWRSPTNTWSPASWPLGVADPDEPANALVTPRCEDFAIVHET